MEEHESNPASNEASDAASPGTSGEPRRLRRPTTLLRERGMRFVNRMRNVGWLAGYVAPGDDDHFLLQQTNNIEQALKIRIDKRYVQQTRVIGRPIMAMVHLRGYVDKHGPQVGLQCIELNKPSVLDLPIDTVWVSGFGQGKDAAKILSKLGRENFSPFDANGELREEFRQYIKSADAQTGEYELDERAQSFMKAHEMLGDVLAASGGVIDSRLDRGQNYVSVAGFVDSKAFVPETKHRKAHGLIMLRQHADQDQNIPVRVTGKMAKAYIEKIHEGSPVLIEGSVRRKVYPNDDGEIESTHTYIETTRISAAQADKDIMSPIPDWWLSIRERLVKRRAERQAAARVPAKAAALTDAELAAVSDQL
jgi:hypothetical protein